MSTSIPPDVQAWINATAREVADEMADLLQQEYKLLDGRWWLCSLGRPQRPLTEGEIKNARNRGSIA